MTSAPQVYTVRANAFEPERTWRLEDAALRWDNKQGPQHFAFANITDIRLEFAPSRANQAQYFCHVGIKSGWTETIPSTHYAGIMNFEDRAADYRAFVLALVQQVAAANPACRLRGGATQLQYLGNIAAIVLSVLMLAFVLLLVGMPLTVIAVIKLALIAFYLPTLLRWFRRNGPARLPTGQAIDPALLQPYLPPQP
jgi:hypothetical protein